MVDVIFRSKRNKMTNVRVQFVMCQLILIKRHRGNMFCIWHLLKYCVGYGNLPVLTFKDIKCA